MEARRAPLSSFGSASDLSVLSGPCLQCRRSADHLHRRQGLWSDLRVLDRIAIRTLGLRADVRLPFTRLAGCLGDPWSASRLWALWTIPTGNVLLRPGPSFQRIKPVGRDLHRRRLWPWLGVPFRIVFRCFGVSEQTSGPLQHTFGGGLGSPLSCACFGHVRQSCLRPFGPTLAPDLDTHDRWIVASQTEDKTDVKTGSGGGREGSLRASASHTPQRARRPILSRGSPPNLTIR